MEATQIESSSIAMVQAATGKSQRAIRRERLMADVRPFDQQAIRFPDRRRRESKRACRGTRVRLDAMAEAAEDRLAGLV
jgi:hypothetical protein